MQYCSSLTIHLARMWVGEIALEWRSIRSVHLKRKSNSGDGCTIRVACAYYTGRIYSISLDCAVLYLNITTPSVIWTHEPKNMESMWRSSLFIFPSPIEAVHRAQNGRDAIISLPKGNCISRKKSLTLYYPCAKLLLFCRLPEKHPQQLA